MKRLLGKDEIVIATTILLFALIVRCVLIGRAGGKDVLEKRKQEIGLALKDTRLASVPYIPFCGKAESLHALQQI